MGKKILIVDDERKIVDMISFNLHKEGYDVVLAYDGERGLELAFSEQPDLILLDVSMPKMDGFEVCRRVREKSQVPIIMLTALEDETYIIHGLETGADDYGVKPCKNRILLARIKANLRRSESDAEQAQQAESVLSFGDLELDVVKYEVRKDGKSVGLTHKEFELFKFLATQSNQVFTRDQLIERVWGYEPFGETRNVDVTIKRLRSKIEDNPEKPRYIISKRSVGYYFNI